SRLSTDVDLHGVKALVSSDPESIVSERVTRLLRLIRRNWLGVAAGLIVGLSSVSVAWAISLAGEFVTMPLALKSIEDSEGMIASQFPLGPGKWSGDDAEVIDFPEAKPGHKKALRFLKAQPDFFEPRAYASACDVFQIVDVRSVRTQIPRDHEAVLNLSADFLDKRPVAGEPVRMGCRMAVFTGDPSRVRNTWPKIQMTQALSSGSDYEWSSGGELGGGRTLQVRSILPPEGDFVVVHLLVYHPPGEQPIKAVFGDHYVRDVNLSVQIQPVRHH
ncbi:MAG: hypothetical protein WCO60_08930, partial [Verrucomicrobiota bacterium]